MVGNCETHQIVAFLCANSIIISRPLENAGTWRGFFEPSTAAFGMERKRVCVDYAICANSTTLKEFRNCLENYEDGEKAGLFSLLPLIGKIDGCGIGKRINIYV